MAHSDAEPGTHLGPKNSSEACQWENSWRRIQGKCKNWGGLKRLCRRRPGGGKNWWTGEKMRAGRWLAAEERLFPKELELKAKHAEMILEQSMETSWANTKTWMLGYKLLWCSAAGCGAGLLWKRSGARKWWRVRVEGGHHYGRKNEEMTGDLRAGDQLTDLNIIFLL